MIWLGIGIWSLPVFAANSPLKSPPTRTTGKASYYTIASAIKEGTCTNAKTKTCLQANGQALKDEAYTAASWDYPLGTQLQVVAQRHPIGNTQSRTVMVTVTDRGPAKRLYRQGRILDLSQAAFEALAPLSQGVIPVSIEVLD